MATPNITEYRIEEIEIPPGKDDEQIILEALGIVEPAIPVGTPRKMLRITLEGDGFPTSEKPFEISIGGQTLEALETFAGGTRASGLLETVPVEGDQIVVRTGLLEEPTRLAEEFHLSKLRDTRIA